MISSLIEQAKLLLNSTSDPSLESLEQAENALSTYLEALATNRISDKVSTDDLEEANRLLRELRREKSRLLSGAAAEAVQPAKSEPSSSTQGPPNRQRQQVDQLKSNFHHQRNSAQRQPHQFWEIFQPVPLRRSPGRTSGQTTWAGSTTIP